MTAITDFNQIVALVKRQHAAYLQHPVFGGKLSARPTGGYFSLFYATTGLLVAQPVLIAPFEDTDRELKCRNLSIEKGKRLLAHPGHVLSRESENPANDQYAGAARGSLYAGSYSGDPAHIDELKMLSLLVKIRDMTRDRMCQILTTHPNDYVKLEWNAVPEDVLIDD